MSFIVYFVLFALYLIILYLDANPYAALPHATDPQIANKLHSIVNPIAPPFYPHPFQQFYPYPPPLDFSMGGYYAEPPLAQPAADQQQSQQTTEPGSQNGTLPPAEIARTIPCRFFPACR